MGRTVFTVVAGMWLLVAGSSTYTQGAERNPMITEKDFVMSQKDASKFSNDVISPIVFDCAEKESEPETLRTRVRAFLEKTHSKQLDYVALPAYFPIRKMQILAQTVRIQSKPTVILFIPEIMNWQRTMSAMDFKYSLLITLSHEMMHLELGHDLSSASGKEAAREEADAWAKTIVEVVRPLQARGLPTSPYFANLSATFQRMNNDSANPNWLKLFVP